MSVQSTKNCAAYRVNALSGLYLISTYEEFVAAVCKDIRGVNALSGLYLISTK